MRMSTEGGRARPLPPDERRAALVAATIPLICEHGRAVTTRLIAEAAGVAEGTIFRAFPSKDALIDAAASAALDPLPLVAELDGIAFDLPLDERLTAATTILQRRLVRIINLHLAMTRHAGVVDHEAHRRQVKPSNERIYAALSRLLEPDRAAFRVPIPEVVRVLRLLLFAGSHPMISEGQPLSAGEIVAVVLDGLRRREDRC